MAQALGGASSDPPPRLKAVGKLRKKVELMVEKGIALLDKWDGDPDLEAEPDEQDADFEAGEP